MIFLSNQQSLIKSKIKQKFKMLAFNKTRIGFLILLFLFLWSTSCDSGRKLVYTQVTFMYNILPKCASSQLKKASENQLCYFERLLSSQSNLIIFGSKDYQEYVWKKRKYHNTVFVRKDLQLFRNLWYNQRIDEIRDKKMKDSQFLQKEHIQFAAPNFNSVYMSKFYALNEAIRHDKWNTDIIAWADGGYSKQFFNKTFYLADTLEKFYQVFQPQWMVFTKTDSNISEEYRKYLGNQTYSYRQANTINMGGYVSILRDIKCAYQNFLRITLENGDMDSYQNVIGIMPFRFPYLIPNTLGLDFKYMIQKLNVYQKFNRIPSHPRSLKVVFVNETIIIKEIKMVNNNFMDEKLEHLNELTMFMNDRKQYIQISYYKFVSYFGILFGAYLFMIKNNWQMSKKY